MTGGSKGIGFGIVAHLLQHGCSALYLLGKKEEHLQEAEEELTKYGDISRVHPIQIELEDLHHVDQVAKELLSKLDRLDGLVCNAGLGVGPYSLSKDNIDSHMQVNHIAQFHLVRILLPLLQKTPDSRITLQSSDFHRFISDVEFKSVDELNQDIGPMKLYARTKLAQILFIHALAERKEKGELGFNSDATVGPWMNATHPGGVKTDQQKQAVDAYGTLGKIGVAAVKPLLKDPVDEGCRPALFATSSDAVAREHIQGQYVRPICDISAAPSTDCHRRLFPIARSTHRRRKHGIISSRRTYGSLPSRYWWSGWGLCRTKRSLHDAFSSLAYQ